MYRVAKSHAVRDTCTGVSTEFKGTVPSSVKPGQGFTLTNISSRPDTSYGATVNSSSLKLSASKVSQGGYNEDNTSTDPSPTTGHPTYTSYYPDWQLTAAGENGEKIVIKLVEATAEVEGFGSVTCTLSETLATVDIAQSESPSSTNTPTTAEQEEDQPVSTSADVADESVSEDDVQDIPESENTENTSFNLNTHDLTINVVSNDGDAVQGASVTIDNQLTESTNSNGQAQFKDIRVGSHTVVVKYGSYTYENKLSVSENPKDNNITINIPISAELPWFLLAVLMLIILVISAVAYYIFHKRKQSKQTPKPVSTIIKDLHLYENKTLEEIEKAINAHHKH